MKTAYTNLYAINRTQQLIIKYIHYWASTENVPIPHRTVLEEMERKGKKKSTIVHNLNGLVRLGYIRRAITTPANQTKYVLLRTL